MTSVIRTMLDKMFGKTEIRVLMLGFDSGGRTTALYQMKLGEVVATIPTIGFNVESIEYKRTSLTLWDVGGRDKIRPLWRHYFQNCQAIIFVLTSDPNLFDYFFDEYVDELQRLLSEDELRDVVFLIWANKQDLPGALSPEEISRRLDLVHIFRERVWHIMGTTATTGEGLHEGMDWIIENVGKSRRAEVVEHRGIESVAETLNQSAYSTDGATATPVSELAAVQPEETKAIWTWDFGLMHWLNQDLEPDDYTLKNFAEGSLKNWDHKSRLRVAWLLLIRDGRKAAMQAIFEGAKQLLKETFHETTLYFWVHMVHYAIVATKNPSGDFKGFLLLNPQLANSNLLLEYYSQEAIWQNPEAQTQVVMPDLKPLPSLVSKAVGQAKPVETHLSPSKLLSDDEFLQRFQDRTLSSWGHDSRLRAIWLLLKQHGRRKGGTSRIFDVLKNVEGPAHNTTETYFWIQIVTAFMSKVGDVESFAAFSERCGSDLSNSNFIFTFYSDTALAAGSTEFVLPDRRQIPNVIR